MSRETKHLVFDLLLVGLSIIVAVVLVRTGAIAEILGAVSEFRFLRVFIAGVLFVSIFTAAPAIVVLAELSKIEPPLIVAFFGGLGSLVGDLLIFRFIRDTLTRDAIHLVERMRKKEWNALQLQPFRWLVQLFGALIIASPLPDEIGLVLLGVSKTATPLFVVISFVFNFLGILVFALVLRAIL